MSSDPTISPKIFGAAKLLIERSGDDAVHEAEIRVEERLSARDQIGHLAWVCVRDMVVEL